MYEYNKEPSLVFDPNDEKDLANTIKYYLLKNEHKIKKSKLNNNNRFRGCIYKKYKVELLILVCRWL